MLAMIGMIMLMGLVTKNGILIVEFTNQLREQGRSTRDALLEAGPLRLRPILMTSVAMIAGMIPVAFARGDGAETRTGMAWAIIGGLIASTVPGGGPGGLLAPRRAPAAPRRARGGGRGPGAGGGGVGARPPSAALR